jgi:hypothetical protein
MPLQYDDARNKKLNQFVRLLDVAPAKTMRKYQPGVKVVWLLPQALSKGRMFFGVGCWMAKF